MKALLLTTGLVVCLAFAAPAQTARIAHLSHAGSLETLAAETALDNFGLGPPSFVPDSIRLVSDTTAVEYGRWHWGRGDQAKEKERTYQYSSHAGPNKMSAKAYLEDATKYRPKVKVVGYDTIPKPAPVLKKQKTKRKKTAALVAPLPAPPAHPGVWVGVAAIVGLAAAGWVLGERRSVTASAA